MGEERTEAVVCGACGMPSKYVEDGAYIHAPSGKGEYRVTEARYCCGMSDCGVAGPIRKTEVAARRAWNRMWHRTPGESTLLLMLELHEVLKAKELRRPIVQISTGRVGGVPLETALAAVKECGFTINP